MAPRRLVPLLVALTLVATTISSARADGHHPLGGSIVTEVPAGGTSTVTSGEYPRHTFEADVLLGTAASDTPLFKSFALILLGTEPHRRNVGCLNIGALAHESMMDNLSDRIEGSELEARAALRGAAAALLCLRIARLLAEIEAEIEAGGRGAERSARPKRCGAIPFEVKVRTTKAEDGSVVLTTRGGLKDTTRSTRAKFSCATTGNKVRLHVRSKRKTPLQNVLGKQVQVGIASPSTASTSVPVKVSFKGR